jgi:DNA-directed RNA polymerase subunit RPC12/RpoP
MLQKCPYCGELIFYREKGHTKEDRCDLRKQSDSNK